ncbi:MAG TPA: MG2 domain-containing protein [Bacteroidia bacterium]|nr:MG2 domain-containing protein [Bacteroidia bacterium]
MKNSGFKTLFFIVVLIFISIAGAYRIQAVQPQKPIISTSSKPGNYNKDWQKVNALAAKGLYKSALETVEIIYKRAKIENNAAQLVKAIIHRMKFEQLTEENSTIMAIDELKEEIKTATYPLKPILHSILAETYWSYYQYNRWKFHNRTTVSTVNNADISTWDLKTIFSKTLENYEQSLQNAEKSKQTPIDIYDEVLVVQKDTRKFRPTLFDFLAHRAIDFYKNDEITLIRPAYKFELNDPSYFAPYSVFATLKLSTKDTLSSPFHALQLMKELITFHSTVSDKDKAQVLVDVDLERLKFVREKSILETKDSLYLWALQNLEKQFSTDPVSAEINYEIAQVYADKGNDYKVQEGDKNRWMKKQALELCEAVIKKYPETIGAKNCEMLKAQIQEHDMRLVTDHVTSPDKPFLGLLTYKNLKNIYIRIIQPKKAENEQAEPALYGEQLINYYSKLPSIKEWTLDLPDDGDYQLHSTEIKIPDLPVGNYVILLASSKEFTYKNNGVSYAPVSVSGISYIVRQLDNGSYDCFVQHRETGVPLKNVTAQLFYEHYNYKTQKREFNSSEKYITDANGYFNIPPADEYRNIRIDFSYDGATSSKNNSDFLRADNVIYQYEVNEMEKKKIPHTIFFLDRGIYRPGQTIYFKGIMMNTDGETNEILPNTKTKVNLIDVNGQQTSSLDLITNEFGTFTGSFTAPIGLLNGDIPPTLR